MSPMQSTVIDAIARCGGRGVSFVELEREVPGFKGDCAIELRENLVIWSHMSEEFCEAFTALLDAKEIALTPTSVLVYMCDGAVPNMPIAKRLRPYKKLRWLPVCVGFTKE